MTYPMINLKTMPVKFGPGSSDEYRTAPSDCRPWDQAKPIWTMRAWLLSLLYSHHHHLLLLSPKADTHFAGKGCIKRWLCSL